MTISAIVFDMDGVLIDARDWHYEALNEALEIFGATISRDDHLAKFDGLPTKKKLSTLVEKGEIPASLTGMIEAIKQERTLRAAAKLCFPRIEHVVMLAELQRWGWGIAVATNSIRETSKTMLAYAGVEPFLDYLVTNEDVRNAKPSPDIYKLACQKLGVSPSRTLVIEDNHNGVTAAREAGCNVIQINEPKDLDLSLIEAWISREGSTFE